MKIKNSQLEIVIDDKSGEFLSIAIHGQVLTQAIGDGELFRILYRRNVDGNENFLSNTDFRTIEMLFERKEPEQYIVIRYRDSHAFPMLQINVEIRLPDDTPFLFAKIAYYNLPSEFYCDWIDFPRIRVPNDLVGTGGNAHFFWPGCEGVEFDELETREAGDFRSGLLSYPLTGIGCYYPGPCPMQFQAYYRPEGGLYFAAHDATHSPKGIEVAYEPGKNAIRPYFQHFAGSQHPMEFTLPYEMVLGGFQGDWQDAALIYRQWMQRCDTALPLKLRENPMVPDWLKNSPVIITYPVRGDGFDTGSLDGNEYFPYGNALPTLRHYQKSWNSPVMALLMHWEGTAPWAPPYVWPPFGGEEIFKTFAKELHQDGNLLGVYCSGTAWTQTSTIDPRYSRTDEFERDHLAREMCKGPQGEMFAKVCNGGPGFGQRHGFEMCPTREWTHKTVCGEIAKIVASDVDYLQFFDQNQGCSAPLCYAAEHGHPQAPGAWLTQGMTSLLDAAEETIRTMDSKAVLGCENGAAEPYIRNLPLSDLRNHLAWFFAKPVPAYAMLFHEYVNNFLGNGVGMASRFDREKSPEFLQYRTAYCFICGDIISVLLKSAGEMHWSWVCKWNAPAPDQIQLMTLIGNLNEWRRGKMKDYLVFGRMEKNFKVECGSWDLHFPDNKRKALSLPSVLGSHWSCDSRDAEILANFRNKSENVSIHFGGRRKGYLYTKASPNGIFFDTLMLSLEVPPLDAVLIEFGSKS